MKILIVWILIFILYACSITRIDRGPEGISVDIYSLGVDRKNIKIDIKKENENQYKAKVTIDSSTQTEAVGKLTEGLAKGIIP